MDAIKAMLHGCENQNEVNTRAIKYMLDAQMIEQLVQRQDVEDRKQLLVLAMKKDKELLSTDLGVTGRDVFGPNTDTRNLKFDRVNKSQHYQGGSMKKKQNQTSQVEVPMVPTIHNKNVDDLTSATRQGLADAVRDFEDNACHVDPPVLKVDRKCMSCAENKALTLNAIKVACLTHTQSAIPYQGKNYHVSEILDAKAQVVAQCQRMLRENLFNTKHNMGVDIL